MEKQKIKIQRKTMILISALVLSIILVGVYFAAKPHDNKSGSIVIIETNQGTIKIKLYDEQMPNTTLNFKNLVNKGYYNNIIFHRIIPGFMIQGGDPTGTGMGDRSLTPIKDEFVEGLSNKRGTIAMANSGPNTGTSQFFINLVDNTFLDWDKPPYTSKHPVFGEVIDGMDIVDKISQVKTDSRDKPLEDIIMLKVYLE